MAFVPSPPWLLSSLRSWLCPPPWPCVPVTLLFTSACAAAAAQVCKGSQVKTAPATHTEQLVCSESSTEWAQKANRAQIVWDQGWEVGTEGRRAGWFWRAAPGQLLSLRNQPLGAKVLGLRLVGGSGRAVKLGKCCSKLRKGPCFAPSATCSINYFPKTIL